MKLLRKEFKLLIWLIIIASIHLEYSRADVKDSNDRPKEDKFAKAISTGISTDQNEIKREENQPLNFSSQPSNSTKYVETSVTFTLKSTNIVTSVSREPISKIPLNDSDKTIHTRGNASDNDATSNLWSKEVDNISAIGADIFPDIKDNQTSEIFTSHVTPTSPVHQNEQIETSSPVNSLLKIKNDSLNEPKIALNISSQKFEKIEIAKKNQTDAKNSTLSEEDALKPALVEETIPAMVEDSTSAPRTSVDKIEEESDDTTATEDPISYSDIIINADALTSEELVFITTTEISPMEDAAVTEIPDYLNLDEPAVKSESTKEADTTNPSRGFPKDLITPTEPYLNEDLLDFTVSQNTVKIRKCCEKGEFFYIPSAGCEKINTTSHFFHKVESISEGLDPANVEFLSGALKQCPDGSSPKYVASVSLATHLLLSTGEIYDYHWEKFYGDTEYCLEDVGETADESALTLAYCPGIPDYSYYDYEYPEYEEPDYEPDYVPPQFSSELTVRKCCRDGEYYDDTQHKCIKGINATEFNSYVQNLSFESADLELDIISSRIKKCPNKIDVPTTIKIPDNVYKLQNNGDLIDTATGVHYDTSLYCLELVGENSSELSFTVALCPKVYYVLPKCCQQNQFFSDRKYNCVPLSKKGKETNLLESLSLDNNTYGAKPLGYFFSCQDSSPSQVFSDEFEFKEDKLCIHNSCYEKSKFCVDYSGTNNPDSLRPMAFFCQTNYFVKCCHQDQILDENGCRNHTGGRSFLTKQLIRTKNIVTSFDYQRCKDNKSILLDESYTSYLHWWLGDDGRHLVLESSGETRRVGHYCIDDFINNEDKVGPGAFVCEEDVINVLPLKRGKPHNLKEEVSFGKCCPLNHDGILFYYSLEENKCKTIVSNNSLIRENQFKDIGRGSLHFHDFPTCSNLTTAYHAYSLTDIKVDHAIPTLEGRLKIIDVEGKCNINEQEIPYEDFCYEYILTSEGNLEPTAFVCPYASVLGIYEEKFNYVTALLAISCSCLFFTLIFLFTMKVRRGMLSIRKVNTLAGKILVSFVASHLIGYISLSLTQHENTLNKAGSVSCYILAGMIQFFNLATFCWNTSICLESFLLTIHIRISEWLRYFLHCLWAWGFPAFMTALMLLMDYYKDDLPCGIITPNVGVHHCFHSDKAILVYFYTPIFITLSANMVFLLGAKALRNSRLKRLEKGGPKARREGTAVAPSDLNKQQNGKTATAASGMRTHQTQNTKVESLRIVLWTGGTWFLELIGFITTQYILPHSRERWYEYLWYIPTSINALRGVGIFAIIVLTPEIRTKIKSTMIQAKRRLRSKLKPSKTAKDKSENNKFSGRSSISNGNSCTYNETVSQNRRTSITTMVTTISSSIHQAAMSIRRITPSSRRESLSMAQIPTNPEKDQRKLSKARSISIILQRGLGLTASEEETELNQLPWRKSSLPSNSLPNVVEEEEKVDLSEQRKVNNVTVSSSDA